jgi:hypothetical protein
MMSVFSFIYRMAATIVILAIACVLAVVNSLRS